MVWDLLLASDPSRAGPIHGRKEMLTQRRRPTIDADQLVIMAVEQSDCHRSHGRTRNLDSSVMQ